MHAKPAAIGQAMADEAAVTKERMFAGCRRIKVLADALVTSGLVNDPGEARISAALCATVAEQYAVTLNLAESRHSWHMPTFVRSMLEAVANLRLLIANPKYLEQLWFDKHWDEVAILGDLLANPTAHDIKDEEISGLRVQKGQAEEAVRALKQKGCTHLEVKDKFKKAGLLHEYTAYRVLCGGTHNQLLHLVMRHAGEDAILYHADAPLEFTENMLGIARECLLIALGTLPKFTDLQAEFVQRETDAIEAVPWART
jgi:hypothetical protein